MRIRQGQERFLFEEAVDGAAPPAPEPAAPPAEPSGSILDGVVPEATPPAPSAPTLVEEGWLKGIDSSLASDSSLQAIGDLPNLVKSYVNAQKLIGKDKVVIPDQYASDDDRRAFLHKLGLPHEQGEYKVGLNEDEARVTKEFVDNFSNKAYELGIMPANAQELLNWYDKTLGDTQVSDAAQYEDDVNSTRDELRQEYGQAYDVKINLANKVLKDIVSEDMLTNMAESGIVNDKAFIQTMVKVGELFTKEGSFAEDTVTHAGALTPEEAQRQINDIQSNLDHPYHQTNHANHDQATKDMQKLFEYLA
jgi:hypothetical protein